MNLLPSEVKSSGSKSARDQISWSIEDSPITVRISEPDPKEVLEKVLFLSPSGRSTGRSWIEKLVIWTVRKPFGERN